MEIRCLSGYINIHISASCYPLTGVGWGSDGRHLSLMATEIALAAFDHFPLSAAIHTKGFGTLRPVLHNGVGRRSDGGGAIAKTRSCMSREWTRGGRPPLLTDWQFLKRPVIRAKVEVLTSAAQMELTVTREEAGS